MFSIIIPIYNVENYLNDCINSVLNQDYKDFELILIDDGSIDKSSEICNFYKEKDNRIKVIHKKNEGVSIARNVGIDISKGEYIIFLDSDDYLSNDAFSKIDKYLKENTFDLIIMSYNKIDSNQIEKINIIDEEYLNLCNDNNIELIEQTIRKIKKVIWHPWSKVFNNSIIKENKIYFNKEYSVGEDCVFFFNYLEYTKNILITNDKITNYRINREGSATSLKNCKNIKSSLNVYFNMYNSFYQKNEFLQNYFANKFCNVISTISILDDDNKKEIIYFLRDKKEIIKDSKGFKYKISKIIWRMFGFDKGTKILNFFHK